MKKQHAGAQGAVQNCMECYVTLLDSHGWPVACPARMPMHMSVCFWQSWCENLTLDDNCMYIVYPIECTHNDI